MISRDQLVDIINQTCEQYKQQHFSTTDSGSNTESSVSSTLQSAAPKSHGPAGEARQQRLLEACQKRFFAEEVVAELKIFFAGDAPSWLTWFSSSVDGWGDKEHSLKPMLLKALANKLNGLGATIEYNKEWAATFLDQLDQSVENSSEWFSEQKRDIRKMAGMLQEVGCWTPAVRADLLRASKRAEPLVYMYPHLGTLALCNAMNALKNANLLTEENVQGLFADSVRATWIAKEKLVAAGCEVPDMEVTVEPLTIYNFNFPK